MKSSFAKTFDRIAKDKKDDMPRDMVNEEKQTIYNITVDGNKIDPKSIYVVDAENEINTNHQITTFLASTELKKRYDAIHYILEKQKIEFIKKLKNKSKSTDCEIEIISTLKMNAKDDFFTCLERIADEVTTQQWILYDFKYNSIFDKKGKVKEFLEINQSLIQE